MNTDIKKLPFIACLVVLFAVGCSPSKEEHSKLNFSNVIPVRVAKPSLLEANDSLVASGILTSDEEARLSFKIGGVVENINVEEGSRVQKGQILANLNLVEINAQLKQAQLAFEKNKRDYERAGRLFEDSVVTLEQYENAETAYELAKKTVELLTFNQQYAMIKSPFSGYVSRKWINEGEIVAAGSPVFTINGSIQSAKWILRVALSDKQWVRVAQGQAATVVFDALPSQIFAARVTSINQSSDQRSGLFDAELTIDTQSDKLGQGMYGSANIKVDNQSKLYGIPYAALLEANGRDASVFVINSDTTVLHKSIKIHSINNDQVLVASGLDLSDQVVISNSAFLNDKSTVKVVD